MRRMLGAIAMVGALLVAGWGAGPAGGAGASPGSAGRARSPGSAEAAERTDSAGAAERAEGVGAGDTAARAVQAATRTTTVRYGPYTIQPAPENPDGTHGHAHSGNQIALGVEKPCTNCYLTSMQADLIKTDGTQAGFSNNLQLHHMVLFNREAGRTDATCPSSLGLLGQRFFASGDERVDHSLPAGYGYRVGTGSWNMIWDLASMSRVAETVYYTVTFEWVPASTPGITDVEPVWLDIDQCGDSQVQIPAGPSSQTWTWNVNRPGDVVAIGGHLHDGGVNLEVRNATTGQLLCNSVAGYGETPLYVDHHGEEHISSMTWCGGRDATQPVGTVATGQRVTITSHYDAPAATDDAMGISLGYIAQRSGSGDPGPGDPGGSGCVTATNSAHVRAGRATSWLFFAWAAGSNDYLGVTSATTSLQQSGAGWERVSRC